MATICGITLSGHLGRDAEVRYTTNGQAVCNFSVAVNFYHGKDSEDTTEWFNCAIWGERAKSVAEYLVKGAKVTVFGQLTIRPYEAKDGGEKLSFDVNVQQVDINRPRDSGEEAPKGKVRGSTRTR